MRMWVCVCYKMNEICQYRLFGVFNVHVDREIKAPTKSNTTCIQTYFGFRTKDGVPVLLCTSLVGKYSLFFPFDFLPSRCEHMRYTWNHPHHGLEIAAHTEQWSIPNKKMHKIWQNFQYLVENVSVTSDAPSYWLRHHCMQWLKNTSCGWKNVWLCAFIGMNHGGASRRLCVNVCDSAIARNHTAFAHSEKPPKQKFSLLIFPLPANARSLWLLFFCLSSI